MPLELNARDLAILEELAKCRMLTTQQLVNEYFDGSTYGYRRITQMEASGLVFKKPLMGNRGKIGACVYLTEQGAEAAGVSLNRARNNYIPHLQAFRALFSELYLQLKPFGWDWCDSREVKNGYSLRRGDSFGGVLTHPNNEKYFVYVTGPSPQPDTVANIQIEANRNLETQSDIRSVIIFSPTKDALSKFVGLNINAYKLLLLEYPPGLSILKRLSNPGLILEHLDIPMDELSFTQVNEPWAQYLVQMGNREHYITELLTNDQSKINHLALYSYDMAMQKNMRGVMIVVNVEDLAYYRETRFPSEFYNHFRFIPVDRSWFEALTPPSQQLGFSLAKGALSNDS
ncbi:MAG: hypothetical protein ACYCX4_01485 [Bacillota bacterium]